MFASSTTGSADVAGSPSGSLDSAADDIDPATEPRALRDRVADEHLVVPVGEGRVARLGRRRTGHDVGVDGSEVGTERIEEALDMAAGQSGRRPAGLAEQRWVPDEDLVRSVPVADPGLVRLLGIPRPGGTRTRRSRTAASSCARR